MEKSKGKKIAYTVFSVILAIVLGVILLNRFGIVDFKEEVNKVTNADYYWQSEPFGEIDAVWYLASTTEPLFENGSYGLLMTLKSNSTGETYQDGSYYSINDLKNLDYNNDNVILNGAYQENDTCYATIFVPLDCEYAEINGERFEIKNGRINSPGGEVEFKYLTAEYKSICDFSDPGNIRLDTLILYDSNGQSHLCVEDVYE